jgi:hypothetical protein
MKNVIHWIKKELELKIDLVNNEYVIGIIWIIYFIFEIIF